MPFTDWINRPCDDVHTQFDEAYSSGAPKMWPVSWPKTLSIDVHVSKAPDVRRMTTRKPPAYANHAVGIFVKNAT